MGSHSPVTSQRKDSFCQETFAESSKQVNSRSCKVTGGGQWLLPEKQSVNLDIVPSKRDSHRTHFLQRNLCCLTGYSECTRQRDPRKPTLPTRQLDNQLFSRDSLLVVPHRHRPAIGPT